MFAAKMWSIVGRIVKACHREAMGMDSLQSRCYHGMVEEHGRLPP